MQYMRWHSASRRNLEMLLQQVLIAKVADVITDLVPLFSDATKSKDDKGRITTMSATLLTIHFATTSKYYWLPRLPIPILCNCLSMNMASHWKKHCNCCFMLPQKILLIIYLYWQQSTNAICKPWRYKTFGARLHCIWHYKIIILYRYLLMLLKFYSLNR